MKKIFFLLACLFVFAFFSTAQLPGVLNRAKQKAANKVNEKIDKTIDKTAAPSSGKPDTTGRETEKKGSENNNKESVPGGPVKQTKDTVKNEPVSIKAYSKYDFVPGEKVIGFEDFLTGSIGDFPAGWNTSGSAEIVTIEGKPGRWLWITKPGVFVPEFTDKYPEDFTFEFDLMHGVPIRAAEFKFVMAELQNIQQPQNWTLAANRFTAGLHTANSDQKEGTATSEIRKNSVSQPGNQFYTDLLGDKFNPIHISVWRQKERVRVYVNQEKIWDIPKAIAPDAKLNAILFTPLYADANIQHYIGNLRLAVGAPDTRKKMLEQNKWVTHGILFDVNSANIKPESYGTLKEMANVLKEYADLKVKIVGHTDADGKDDANLDLSKRRAASVKAMLAKEFGIDESRMETTGKGEGEPIDKNDTPAGKANNRRVEFIKL
jgi:outer membrane protein OmpA-like peptidoglycan-associated protein